MRPSRSLAALLIVSGSSLGLRVPSGAVAATCTVGNVFTATFTGAGAHATVRQPAPLPDSVSIDILEGLLPTASAGVPS